MLNLSNGSISLVKSGSFIRLAIFVHAAAIYILWCSAFLVHVKLIVSLLLLVILRKILLDPSGSISFKQLDFQSGKWFLYDKDGRQYIYEKHCVVIEAGIFFLLELSNTAEKINKTVFFDQLSAEDYRTLKLLEKTY